MSTERREDQEAVRLGACLCGLAAFIVYGVAVAPAPYLLDSAELADAAFTLGIAHPPGEPLAVLWGKLWTLLPLGTVALRVGLAQAAAAGVAVALVYVLAHAAAAALDPDRHVPAAARAAIATAGALLYAFAPGSVLSAARPEVYALQTALSLGAVALGLRAARTDDGRPAIAGALLIGLGVANHPLLAGLVGVGAVVAALPLLSVPGQRQRLIGASALAFSIGAVGVLAFLPLRAATMPALAWGDARSVAGLWWLLSARTFTAKSSLVQQAARPGDAPFVLMDEVGPWAAALGVLGAAALLRRRSSRRVGVTTAVAATGSLAAALVAGLDPANPDIRGYLGAAVAVLAVWAASGALELLRALPGRRLILAGSGVAIVAVLAASPRGVRAGSRRHAWAADALASHLLSELPSRAALLTGYFQTAFLVGYLRHVEGQRPDIAWAHLGFVRGPGYAERVFARDPDLGAFLAAFSASSATRPSLTDLARLRPVRVEVDLHLDADVLRRLHPSGLTWTFAPDDRPPRPVPDATARRRLTALEANLSAEVEADRELRGFLAWRVFLDTDLACRNRLTLHAELGARRLAALVPEDRAARALIARCTR